MATSVYYLPIAKNSWENFYGTLKNHESYESLAQQIFPVYGELAIKLVSLFKYFKSSSLFCNAGLSHLSLHCCSQFHSGNSEGKGSWLHGTLHVDQISPNIHSYIATRYYLDQFLASLVWPDRPYFNACKGNMYTSTSCRQLKATMCTEQNRA